MPFMGLVGDILLYVLDGQLTLMKVADKTSTSLVLPAETASGLYGHWACSALKIRPKPLGRREARDLPPSGCLELCFCILYFNDSIFCVFMI